MKGITLGRLSTDVLVVILWRFDRSGGIYRTERWKPKSPALPRSNAGPMKSETQTARSVCWSFIQFRYKILVSRLNEISHLQLGLPVNGLEGGRKVGLRQNHRGYTKRKLQRGSAKCHERHTWHFLMYTTARNFVGSPWSIDLINTVKSSSKSRDLSCT